jgi:alanyl-tRNA synthetase
LKVKAAVAGSAPAGGAAGDAAGGSDVQQVDGIKLIARRVQGLDKGALRGVSDSLRDRLGSGVVVLASEQGGKVALLVSVTKDLTGRVQAGRMIKELAPIVGGGGGGRPDFAEAGGRDAARIDELLSEAPRILHALLS